MSCYINPFEVDDQTLHTYISQRRINIVDDLLFLLREKYGLFCVYSSAGVGATFMISQISKLLNAHENVFYLDGKKMKSVLDLFRKEFKLKKYDGEEEIIDVLKKMNVKGKHSVFILEHCEKFPDDEFIALTNIIKAVPFAKVLIFGKKRSVKILARNLKMKVVYKAKLKAFSFIESYRYLAERFGCIMPSAKLSKVVHRKALLWISFVCHGKPQILNKIAGESLNEAIRKNRMPLRFRQALMTTFKFSSITFPFFPINWGVVFVLLVFLLIGYLFYLPISRSITEFKEEKLKERIEQDMKKLSIAEEVVKEDEKQTTPVKPAPKKPAPKPELQVNTENTELPTPEVKPAPAPKPKPKPAAPKKVPSIDPVTGEVLE